MGADKMVIKLEGPDGSNKAALLVLKMETGAVVTVLEYPGAHAAYALECAGVENYVMVNAPVRVSRDEVEWHMRNWGPMSRFRILVRGEELCRPGAPLAVLASRRIFRKVRSEDRELVAALWLIWKRGGEGQEMNELGVVTVQIDRYLLCEKDGCVTVQKYKGVAVASDRLAESYVASLLSRARAYQPSG